MTLRLGSKLGPYEILAPIGAGGMGEVYRALDTRLERHVAIKVLPELSAAGAHARFEREAKMVAALSHPNILAIYDVVLEGPTPFAVTELLEGETLADRLRVGPLPWRQVLSLSVAAAEAMSAAHARSIIHRDLKPSNLFLTNDGRLKVLDFGLARSCEAPMVDGDAPTRDIGTPEPMTTPGTILGSAGYMSPEQVQGLSLGPESDVFSFGCVLYEMLTGVRAFGGRSMAETLAAVLRDEPEPVENLVSGLPPHFAAVVSRCLQKDVRQRFRTATEVLGALRILERDPGDSTPTLFTSDARSSRLSAVPAPTRPTSVGRGRAFAAACAAVLALAGTGLLVRSHMAVPPHQIKALAVLPLVNLSGDASQDLLADGLTEELIGSLIQLGGVRVICRTTAMRYKNSKLTAGEIARELKVDAVVEGSLKRSGNTVRISAALVRAVDEQSLLSQTFEREIADILTLQSEISRAVSVQIGATLAKTGTVAPRRQVEPAAYEAHMKALQAWARQDLASYEEARDLWQQAIVLDSGFAPAYAHLAGYFLAAAFEGNMATQPALAQVEVYAKKSLSLDPETVDAHFSLADVYYYRDGNLAKSFEEIREVKSKDFAILRWELGVRYREMGRFEESIRELESGLKIDPMSQQLNLALGTVKLWKGDPTGAVTAFGRAVELYPGSVTARELLSDAFAATGDLRRAADELTSTLETAGFPDWADDFRADFLNRDFSQAQRELAKKRLAALHETAHRRYVAPIAFAGLELQSGNTAASLDWLDRAAEDGSMWLRGIGFDPVFAPLREEPRFRAIVARFRPRA